MIKAVIFDFDSTLVDYHYGDKKAIDKVGELLPDKINKSLLYEKSGDIIWQFYKDGFDHGSNVHEFRLKRTLEEFGFSWDNKYLQEYLKIYLNEVRLYEGVIELLKYLQGKVKLGLLTNSTDVKEQKERIKNSKIENYFDKILIAKEIGFYKPQKEAFLEALYRLEVSKDEAIYIGDSEHFNIEGAKNAGLIAIKKLNSDNKTTSADSSFTSFSMLKVILTMEYMLS